MTWGLIMLCLPQYAQMKKWFISLRSHKRQVTFSEPFLGVPRHLDYTQNLQGDPTGH